jgi:hypothetical protein
MPSIDDHLAKASEHEQKADAINTPDWQVVAYFYAAVHLINAALLKLGTRVSNHNERREEIDSHSQLRSIKRQYKLMCDTAFQARYECFPASDYTKDVSDSKDNLTAIKNHILALLKTP